MHQTSSQEIQSPLGSFREEEDPFSEKSLTDEEEDIPLKVLAKRTKSSSLPFVSDVSSSDQSFDGGQGCEVREECTLLSRCDVGALTATTSVGDGETLTQARSIPLELIKKTERTLEMKKQEAQNLQVEIQHIEENLEKYKESLSKLM